MYPLILQIIGFAAAAWIAYLSQPGSSLFSWHPTLMAFAFLVVMPMGLFAFSTAHPIYRNFKRSNKTLMHWVCQSIAVTSALVGLVVMVTNKDNNGSSHFTTRHGQFGLLTCVLMVGASSGGFFVLNSKLVKAFIKPAALRSIHALLGSTVVYPLAMTTVVLATYSNFMLGVLPVDYMRYSIAAAAVVMAIGVYAVQVRRSRAARAD